VGTVDGAVNAGHPGDRRGDGATASEAAPGAATVPGAAAGLKHANMAGRLAAAFQRRRDRHPRLDHIARAAVRYDAADGGRLAAAVTYYAFFATFGLALLGFSVLGFVLDNPTVVRTVASYLADNLPHVQVQALRNSRGIAGVIALIVLPVTGVFWADSLRSSIRAIWRLNEYPGSYVRRQILDMTVLVGLGILLLASLSLAFGTKWVAHWLVLDAANASGSPSRILLAVVRVLVGIGVNTLLSVAVLSVLPQLHVPFRRVIGPALLIAIGLEVLKTLGQVYVHRTESNPAYQIVATAVGLLVLLNLLNQLILFAAALTATGSAGRVVDYATGRPGPVSADSQLEAALKAFAAATPALTAQERADLVRRRT
jgi:membrane protein